MTAYLSPHPSRLARDRRGRRRPRLRRARCLRGLRAAAAARGRAMSRTRGHRTNGRAPWRRWRRYHRQIAINAGDRLARAEMLDAAHPTPADLARWIDGGRTLDELAAELRRHGARVTAQALRRSLLPLPPKERLN